MSTIALIDTTEMRVVKTSDDAECLEYWAALSVKTNDFTIRDIEPHDFDVFTRVDLDRLFHSLSRFEVDASVEREFLVQKIIKLIDSIPFDETPLATLKKRYGGELTVDYTPPEDEERGTRRATGAGPRMATSAIPTRPAEGTTTRLVWDIADQLFLEYGDMPPRNEIIEACVNNDIHPSTAATQYSKWKRNKLGV